ncbi:aminopeptidase [bacterium]|nr:aminopeptidase [bacterium]
MPDTQKLRDYAELIVAHGVNVQEGQCVLVSGEVPHRELLLLISQFCYERGASFVQVELTDERFARQRVDASREEDLSSLPRYISQKYDFLVEEQAATVKIVGPEFPEIMQGAEPRKTNLARKTAYEAKKRFYDEGIDTSRVHWTVAAGATERWGERVFPELRGEAACEALWEDIFALNRIGAGDHLEQWAVHDEALRHRAAWLTSLKIASLHFVGEGTDLLVGLSDSAIFQGGRSKSGRGVLFEPNLPTEECFSTPDWRHCEGTVRATRPFYVNGELIQGLQMTIQGGEITSFSAEKGYSVFEEYLASDPGAKRLGEVALVPISSPIFQAGRVYEEILFDENAACHIAIGSAYRFCVDLPSDSSDSEYEKVGCNTSSVHTDIMISDENTSVSAVLRDGSRRELLRHGEWIGE